MKRKWLCIWGQTRIWILASPHFIQWSLWTGHSVNILCPAILHLTSNGSRYPVLTTEEVHDPSLVNHRTASPWHQQSCDPSRASQHPSLGFICCTKRHSPCGKVTCAVEKNHRGRRKFKMYWVPSSSP